jgi:hypothetical protein
MVDNYIKQFKKTQQEAAEKFGLTQGRISQLMGYLKLPEEVRKNINALIISDEGLQALKALPPDHQQQVAQELKEGSLRPEQIQKRYNPCRNSFNRRWLLRAMLQVRL